MLEGTGCLSAQKPNFAELSEQGMPGCQLISRRRKKKKKNKGGRAHSTQLCLHFLHTPPRPELGSGKGQGTDSSAAASPRSHLLDPQCCSWAVLRGGAAGTEAGRALQRGSPLPFPPAQLCFFFLLPRRNPQLGRGAGAAAPRTVGSGLPGGGWPRGGWGGW